MKKIAVLGCTGSIGTQTLAVARAFPDRFAVVGLAAGNNSALLSQQAYEFKPLFVHSLVPQQLDLPEETSFSPTLEEVAILADADLVVVATSGSAGLIPALTAVKHGKHVAIANKEPLVMAGELLIAEAKASGISIIPIDSEHSAIWQCLMGENGNGFGDGLAVSENSVSRLILTASGGPFREHSKEQLATVTSDEALQHPNWNMGTKITIDSATMMNKGLEVIEARWLFDIPFARIDVLVHRESIIHSMVEFIDGAVKAQLGIPDMRLPIQLALTYPERLPNPELPKLDWSKIGSLTFQQPDTERFPCLGLAREAALKGGTYPAVLCAADEVAVELFVRGNIGFLEISSLVEKALGRHHSVSHPSLTDILAVESETRDEMKGLVRGWC